MANAKRIPRIGLLLPTHSTYFQAGNWLFPIRELFEKKAAEGLCTFEIIGTDKQVHGAPDLPGPAVELVKKLAFDGIVACSVTSDMYHAQLAQLGIPLVAADFDPQGRICDAVSFDGQQGGQLLGQKLRETGHKNVIFAARFGRDLTAPKGAQAFVEDEVSIDRRLGVLTGLEGGKAEMWSTLPIFPGNSNTEIAERLKRMIDSYGRKPDALTGHDGGYIDRVREVLPQVGLDPVRDISICTFHARPSFDTPAHSEVNVSHTVFSVQEMANESWRLLEERLSGKVPAKAAPRLIKLPGRFVDRGTIRNLAGK